MPCYTAEGALKKDKCKCLTQMKLRFCSSSVMILRSTLRPLAFQVNVKGKWFSSLTFIEIPWILYGVSYMNLILDVRTGYVPKLRSYIKAYPFSHNNANSSSWVSSFLNEACLTLILYVLHLISEYWKARYMSTDMCMGLDIIGSG
jgi:hypothetical protein